MITRKSTPEEIRERFDRDVERFSNLETGQSATVDAPLGLELIVSAAAAVNPAAATLLDIGCGAGNYTLKMMQSLPLRSVTGGCYPAGVGAVSREFRGYVDCPRIKTFSAPRSAARAKAFGVSASGN